MKNLESHIKYCSFLGLLVLYIGCKTNIEPISDNLQKEHPISESSSNQDKTISSEEDNTMEFSEFFNSANDLIGEVHNLNLVDQEFVFLSAYVLSPDLHIELFYRIENENGWSDWNSFPHDHEVLSEERTVFKGPYIFSAINNIQFKTSQALEEEIFFRFFIAN